MNKVKVALSKNGTISSTITSLSSLLDRIPKMSVLKTIAIHNMYLTLEFEDTITSNNQNSNPQTCIWKDNILSKVFQKNNIRQSLIAIINELNSIQIRNNNVIDVTKVLISDQQPNDSVIEFHTTVSSFSKNPLVEIKSMATPVEYKEIEEPTFQERLLIIDFNNLVTTCYYAMAAREGSELIKSSQGLYTSAIKPFLNRLISMIRKYMPTHLVFAMDVARSETFRRKLYPGYKANRDDKEKPDALTEQLSTARKLLHEMNIKVVESPAMEADDVIGYITKRWIKEDKGKVVILSNDKDLYQLLEKDVIQVIRDNSEMTHTKFFEKHGFECGLYADYKAICGEAGDNIPGTKGVGEKAAPLLLKEYGGVENILSNLENFPEKLKRYAKNFTKEKELTVLSKKLALLECDIPTLDHIPLEQFKMNINKRGMRTQMDLLNINL
ncbi:5'-3' exonuclease [Paenibacillus sp. CFBP13512]|uniref:5'-3' exonuclease n=1 Tax=Paenibacillus sp. CFBP13512 TaxID=2184007 RepID=UPI0013763B12|nr:5'-3' exonuclease [Paenibacillus sp. CFBP13512]